MAKQYRPSLSLFQIKHICNTYSALPYNPEVEEIRAKLSAFYLKASVGAVSSSHASQSLTEKMGLSESEEEVGKAEYEKWRKYGAALCSTTELNLAYEYGYLNDLLTPEEEATYEASQST